MLACWHGCRKAVRSSMMSGRGVLLGYPSTWGWFGAHQTHENSPQTQVLVHHWLGAWINGWDCSLRESGKQENPTLIFTRCWPSLLWGRDSRTHTIQLERREEEEEGERDLSRFGGCEPICFKPVIGGSNVQTWWAHSTLRVLWFGQLVWGLVEQSIRFDRGFVSSGDCSFSTEQFR